MTWLLLPSRTTQIRHSVCVRWVWLAGVREWVYCMYLVSSRHRKHFCFGGIFFSPFFLSLRARRWCFRVFAFVSNSRCGGSLSMQAQLMHVVTHRWICCKRGEQQKIPLNMHDCAKVKSCDKHLKPIHWKAFVIVRSRKCACAWM